MFSGKLKFASVSEMLRHHGTLMEILRRTRLSTTATDDNTFRDNETYTDLERSLLARAFHSLPFATQDTVFCCTRDKNHLFHNIERAVIRAGDNGAGDEGEEGGEGGGNGGGRMIVSSDSEMD